MRATLPFISSKKYMPNLNVESLLRAANARLKAAKTGVTLEIRPGAKQMLYIRGTFPPKPGSDRHQPYQQRHALKVPATPETIREAELQCKKIGIALHLGEFSWEMLGRGGDTSTVGYWFQQFEQQFWTERDNTAQNRSTWRDYSYWLEQLDPDAPMAVEYLAKRVGTRTKPDSAARKNMVTAVSLLAEYAGLDSGNIKRLRGNYSSRSVDEKTLPADSEIEESWQRLTDAGSTWRWVFGVIAAYGIRPHELFYLDDDFSTFPELVVRDGSKTGRRNIVPLHYQWAELWDLGEVVMPKLRVDGVEDNVKLGHKISGGFYNLGLQNPYQYRHAFAVRARMVGLDAEAAAHYLGHSVLVYHSVYLRSAGEEPYREAYRRILGN